MSQDPFSKYGGKEISNNSSDPFAKYGGKQVSQSQTEKKKESPSKSGTALDLIRDVSKSSSASSSQETKRSSASTGREKKQSDLSIFDAAEKAFAGSFMPNEAIEDIEIRKANIIEASKPREDGIYTYDGSSSIYKKEGGKWYVDPSKSGHFQPLSKGDVDSRIAKLEKGAKTYFGADISLYKTEKPIEWSESQQQFNEQKAQYEKTTKIGEAVAKYIDAPEEFAVESLSDAFKGTEYDIFNFEEYGAGDKMRVTNRETGQSMIFDLRNSSTADNDNEKQMLKSFIDVNLRFPEYNRLFKEKTRLISEIGGGANTPLQEQELRSQLQKVEEDLRVEEAKRRGYAIETGKFASAVVFDKRDKVTRRSNQQVMDDDIDALSVRSMQVKNDIKEIQEHEEWLLNGLKEGSITPEEYDKRINDPLALSRKDQIQSDYNQIVRDGQNLSVLADENDKLAVGYFEAMKNRGDAVSLGIQSFVKGFMDTYLTLYSLGEGEKPNVDWGESLSEILPGEITEEYINNPDLPMWQKALSGIMESLGNAVSVPVPGAAAVEGAYSKGLSIAEKFVEKNLNPTDLALVTAASSNFYHQMDGQEFEGVPEWEKVGLSLMYGVVSGKLEKYGLTKSLSKTPVGNKLSSYIMTNVFKELPKGASAEIIDQAVDSQVKTLIAKGVINIGGSAIVEGSTEAGQEIVDMTLKTAYNAIKGKDYLDTPQTFADALNQATDAFKIGLLGGTMMNTISQATSTPRKLRTASQLRMIEESIANPEIKKMFQNNIKSKVVSGEMTRANAESILKEMDESQALLEKIPDVVEDKYESFGLLAQKEELVRDIQGKDESLTTVQREKIRAIDERLAEISVESMKPKSADAVITENNQNDSKNDTEKGKQEGGEPKSEDNQMVRAGARRNGADMVRESTDANNSGTMGVVVGIENGVKRNYTSTDESNYGEVEYSNETEETSTSIDDENTNELQEETEDVFVDESGDEEMTFDNENFMQESSGESLVNKDFPDKKNAVSFEVKGRKFNFYPKPDAEGFYIFDDETGRPAYGKAEVERLGKPNKNNAKELLERRIDHFLNTPWGQRSKLFGEEKDTKAYLENYEAIANLDLTDKTNLQRVQSFLDGAINSIDKFGKETLGVNLPVAVAKVVLQTVKKIVDGGVTLEQAIKKAAAQHKVNEVDIKDTIKTLHLKQAESISKEKKVSDASKAAKAISKPKKKMIVIDEKKALVDQIKLEAKAAMDKKKQVKDVLTGISDSAKALQRKGKISTRQMTATLSAMKGLNLDNPKAVDKFIARIGKIMNDAEFADKSIQADATRRQIKRSFKNKSNPFVSVAKGFAELNPKWVDDLDLYLEMAQQVKSSLRPTAVRKGEVKFKEEADMQQVAKYVAQEQEKQTDILAEGFRKQYEKITGNQFKGESVGEMRSEMLKAMDEEKVDYTDAIREQLRDRLEEFRAITIDENPPEIEEALDMDIDLLDQKAAIRLLDALDSYIANGSVGGIRAQIATYNGIKNSRGSKLKATNLRLAGSEKIGRLQNDQFTNLNITTERMFKGVEAGLQFRRESGIQGIINGSNKAETEAKTKEIEFIKRFSKSKKFDSAENIFERGALAFLRRNVADGDQQAEFDRRKNLLLESQRELSRGNTEERSKAEVYKKVFEKIGLTEDATLSDIESKVSPINKQAADFITDMWSERYGEVSDFALGVHNILMPQDVNYTPDKFSSTAKGRTDSKAIDEADFVLSSFTNSVRLDKNEAGVLIESKRPSKLPKGRYVDLDFDTNMFRAYRLALVDMYTSESVRQSEAYLRSPEFEEKVIQEDREILNDAISFYVRSKKGKYILQPDSIQKVSKFANTLGALGAGRALGGAGQAVMQFTTANFNTFANAGEHMKMGDLFSKDVQEFINRSGRAIANRGLESLTTLDKADTLSDKAVVRNTIGKFTLDPIINANRLLLKYTLQKPDVAAARIAWMAYYRQSMKKQGLEVDLKGEVNEKAADYAQSMVDRAMDVSDSDLRGKFFREREPYKQFLKQVFFPFATFALNQKNRMWNDFSVLGSSVASKEDKTRATRSLMGLTAETIVYNGVRYVIGRLIVELAMNAMGMDDEEQEAYLEQYNNDKNLLQSTLTKAFQDLVSPSPVADPYLIEVTNWLLRTAEIGGVSDEKLKEAIDAENEKRWYKYEDPMTGYEIEKLREKLNEKEQFQLYESEPGAGMLGIQKDKIVETIDMIKAATTGNYTQESKYGDQQKVLTDEGQDKMIWPTILKIAGATVAPREVDQMANKMFKIVKDKYGMTENQGEKVEELKSMGIEVDDDLMKMIKAKKGMPKTVDGLADEIEYYRSLSKSEQEEYWKEATE